MSVGISPSSGSGSPTHVQYSTRSTSTAPDEKASRVAKNIIPPRPLHEGTIEGMLVNSDAISAVDAIRSAVTVIRKEEPVTLDPLPIGSGLITAAVGVLQVQRGLYGVRDASQTQDTVGIISSLTRFSRAPGDVTRATAKIAKASIDMAGKTSAFSTVVTRLGIVSAAGTTVTALSLFALCMNYLAEAVTVARKFTSKLKEGHPQAVQYLKDMRCLSKEEEQKVLRNLFDVPKEPAFTKACKKVAHYVTEKFFGNREPDDEKKLKAAIRDASAGNISSLMEIVQQYSCDPDNNQNFTPKQKEILQHIEQSLGNDNLQKVEPAQIRVLVCQVEKLYDKALDNEKKRKETVFVRTVGNETQKLLDSLMNKNNVTLDEMKEVTQSAQRGLYTNSIILVLGLIGVTLWVALTMAAQVCTGGAYILAELVMNLVLSVIFLVVDGYYLWQNYKHSYALQKDKIFMFVGTLLGVAAAAIGAAFAKSAVSMGVTAAAAFIWLGVILYTLYQWKSSDQES
jgi:hypothetical protein